MLFLTVGAIFLLFLALGLWLFWMAVMLLLFVCAACFMVVSLIVYSLTDSRELAYFFGYLVCVVPCYYFYQWVFLGKK